MAAAEKAESAGNADYQARHMAAIFKEGFSFSGFERDLLSLNLGSGRFLDVSGVSGTDSVSDGRGALFADLDNDGDLDIFLTAVQGEAHYLFRNNVGAENNFVRVSLRGGRRGRDAYGALVRVKTSAGVQTKIKAGGSGYVSQSDPRLLFGLGRDAEAEWVEVTWPDGATQRVEGVAAGRSIEVVEGEEGQAPVAEIAERRFTLVDPLPAAERVFAKLAFRRGEAFPDILLRTHDARDTRLSERMGGVRRTLVNLWATYCIPCRNEMPELQRLHPRLRDAGIDLIGVSIDVETLGEVPAFVAEMGITYPVFTTEEASVPRIFPRGEVMIPMSFLLDERGRVVEVFAGWNAASEEAILRLAGARHAVTGG